MKAYFVSFFLICLGTATVVSAQTVEKIWETAADLTVCESVLDYNGMLYVSCINGKPDQESSLGYISQVGPDGKIIKLKWSEGLSAPKGMGIWKNILYVTDVHQIVLIDLSNGQIKNKIRVPGAKFLNDISVDQNGNVAVSDMNDNAIYIVKGEDLQLLIRDALLDRVNGLYFDNTNQLYAGTSKGIYKIDSDKKEASIYIPHEGGIDGLEQISEGKFLTSDWQGHVYILEEGKEARLLLDVTTEKKNAADIGYDANTKIIYIPTFFANSVMAYKIILP